MPTDINTIKLTGQQQTLLELMLGGVNVFVNGAAGTGKSVLIHEFQNRNIKRTLYLAPTGMAAQTINGVTIHSCFGFIPGILNINTLVQSAMKNKQLFQNVEVILLDEISMVRAEIFEAMNQVMRQCGDPLLPFGGKQIIVCGDFMQLPPVVSCTWHYYQLRRLFHGIYAFNAPAWESANFKIAYLSRNFRQRDFKFQQILQCIRYCVYPDLNKVISELNTNNYTADITDKLCDDKTIFLCSNQQDVKNINQQYRQLYSNAASITSIGRITGSYSEELPVNHTTHLFVGQQVMFVKNEYHNGKVLFTNGEIGIITGVDSNNGNYVAVRTKTGIDKIVYKSTWESCRYRTGQDENGNPTLNKEIIGTYTQFPLISAKAISVHRSQGKSLDNVCIVPGEHGFFNAWQFYVALSRCRALDKVSINRSISNADIQVDEKVIEFYSQVDQEVAV